MSTTQTTLQSIDLREESQGIHGAPRYFADNRKVTREQFQAIKNSAVRLECLSNSQVNGVWNFYSVARINA
jgi:hypothetical protein